MANKQWFRDYCKGNDICYGTAGIYSLLFLRPKGRKSGEGSGIQQLLARGVANPIIIYILSEEVAELSQRMKLVTPIGIGYNTGYHWLRGLVTSSAHSQQHPI